MLRNLKHILIIALLSLSIIVGYFWISQGQFNDAFNGFFIYRTGNNTWQDAIYAHTLEHSRDIAIIKIDNDSINKLQANGGLKMLNIPKAYYTTLLQKLESVGVKGVGFDIIFENADEQEQLFANELSKYNNVVIATSSETSCIGKLQKKYISLKTRVSKYNDNSATLGIPKVTFQDPTNGDIAHVGETECPKLFVKLIQSNTGVLTPDEKSDYAWMNTIHSGTWKNEYTTRLFCQTDATGGVSNCSGVPRSLYGSIPWGVVNMSDHSPYSRTTSIDISDMPYRSWKTGTGGVVRKSNLIINTLPLELYRLTEGLREPAVEYERQFTLNPYFGEPNIYPAISFIDALEMGKVSARATFGGKYVFIGESGTAIHDSFESPVSGTSMDGVESHAHYLDGLLQNSMLSKLEPDIQTGVLILTIIVAVTLYFLGPSFLTLFIAIICPIFVIFLTRYVYDAYRIVLDIFPLFLATSILTYPITYIYKYFIIDREKRILKSNFSRYIDPHVVNQIVKQGSNIELGGERKELTVLFSDIAGFTSISEKLDPRDLFYLMTSYLSNMTDILIKEGGTLDKYIGDAVMGFFGAPISYEDHAIRAADTALLMQQALPDFNASIEKHGIDPIHFRVGIATGDVMVGNIGSHDRFNYTVLGDTVNTASRLESLGKEYGVNIILSEKTKQALGPKFFARELDTIAVKGKTEGVRIYELVGYSEDYVDRTMFTMYERALGLYRAGEYREAGKIWQSQATIDIPSKVMMVRCYELIKGTITLHNGVYVMDHK